MTLEEEFESIYDHDPAAICDLLNATGRDQKIFYKDPLFDLFIKLDEHIASYHQIIEEFNKKVTIKIDENDVPVNFSDFKGFVSKGLSKVSFKAYCKVAFVKAMNLVPDDSIERWYDGNDSDYLGLSFMGSSISAMPSYIKKYITLTIPKIEFQSCDQLTHLDLSDTIDHKFLMIANCNSLVSLKTFSCNRIQVSGKALSKFEVIENPYGLGDENVIELVINKTAITSLTDIIVQPEKNCYYRMWIPSAVNSLENPAYPDEMQLHYYLVQKSQLNSFFGLKANQVIYFLMYTSPIVISDIVYDDKLMEVYLPNINNVSVKYKGYQEILEAYPDLLKNSLMATVYKGYEPDSVMKFKMLLNKFKTYNADMDKINLLINLLLK